jgi:spore germination cell wall hydrolase CwlJ-like protein
MKVEVDNHIEIENGLKNQIDDLNSQVSFYKNSYEKKVFVEKETQCLAKNIYYEIGTRSDEGMKAIAQVTLNRKREGFANTICGVVYQKSGNICQFSWVCEKHKSPAPSLYKKAYDVAEKSLMKGSSLISLSKALYFHADYSNPSWKSEKNFVAQIGPHIFYSEK